MTAVAVDERRVGAVAAAVAVDNGVLVLLLLLLMLITACWCCCCCDKFWLLHWYRTHTYEYHHLVGGVNTFLYSIPYSKTMSGIQKVIM